MCNTLKSKLPNSAVTQICHDTTLNRLQFMEENSTIYESGHLEKSQEYVHEYCR